MMNEYGAILAGQEVNKKGHRLVRIVASVQRRNTFRSRPTCGFEFIYALNPVHAAHTPKDEARTSTHAASISA